jgi:hypothetical protein
MGNQQIAHKTLPRHGLRHQGILDHTFDAQSQASRGIQILSRSFAITPETQPAEVFKRRDFVVCVGTAPRISFVSPPSPKSFTEFINTEQFREHIGEITITDDTTTVARALQNNQAIAVCDGSFKDGRGAASAVIQGTNSVAQIRTDTIVTGHESHQCSFRSEATGILSTILTVNAICRYHSITKGAITLGCDGESVLTKIRYHKEPINPDSLHFDIVSLIRRQIDASPIKWDFVFIKGHQSTQPFDRPTTLNTEMDLACKAAWNRFKSIPNPSGEGLSKWEVTIRGTKVVSKMKQAIIDHVQDLYAARYWENKGLTDVEWDVTAKVSKSMPKLRRQWISKHSTGFCGCGVMMKRMKLRETDTCPKCEETETAEHVWKCQQQETSDIWEASAQNLTNWMTDNNTHPHLAADIIAGLNHWRNGTPIPAYLTVAGQKQQEHGWRHFFEARPNEEWSRAQHAFYKARPSCTKTGLRWSVAIHQRLLNTAWDFWSLRNEVLHNTDLTLKWEILNAECTILYENKPTSAEPWLMNLFPPSLEILLAKSGAQKQDWVSSVSAGMNHMMSSEN